VTRRRDTTRRHKRAGNDGDTGHAPPLLPLLLLPLQMLMLPQLLLLLLLLRLLLMLLLLLLLLLLYRTWFSVVQLELLPSRMQPVASKLRFVVCGLWL
jgi:hypothetical protein